MRLVQELESHSAQRADAIANLQNTLNGIGKSADVAEAAGARRRAAPAPPAPRGSASLAAPAVDVDLAAAPYIVPAADARARRRRPRRAARVPGGTPPEHTSAATPPSEGDAGALAALARGRRRAVRPRRGHPRSHRDAQG